MDVSFTVEGAGETIAAFEKVQKGVANLKELNIWGKVRQAFYKVQKDIFGSEGSSGASGKWAALSSPYKEIKQKKYGNKPILQATGKMYKEFTASAKVDEGATEMTLSFSSPAQYHAYGTSKMPKRSMLELTDEQKDKIAEPIRFGLKQLAGNARLRDLRG